MQNCGIALIVPPSGSRTWEQVDAKGEAINAWLVVLTVVTAFALAAVVVAILVKKK